MTKRSVKSLGRKALVKLINDKSPFALFHNDCGKLAMYLAKKPDNGIILQREDCILPNGDIPNAPKCFSCNAPLSHQDFNPINVRTIQ